MTTQQPEALRLAGRMEWYCISHTIDADMKDAAKELRRLHDESEQHLQELRSYRITVENREARIAELEAQLAAEQQGVQPVATRYRFIVNGRSLKWEVGDVEMMDNPDFLEAQKQGKFEMYPLYTHPTTQGMDAQQLHSDIMNIQAGKHMGLSYREGHRDARHAAAELVLAAQAKQGGAA